MHADDAYGDVSVKLQGTEFSGNSAAFASLVGDERTTADSVASFYSDIEMAVCELGGQFRSAETNTCALSLPSLLLPPFPPPSPVHICPPPVHSNRW
jgi:hypothetical protein